MKLKLFISVVLIGLAFSTCSKKSIDPTPLIKIKQDTLTFLGFEDKFALQLNLAQNYLYVCAGSNGLWRKNFLGMTPWEYLGLADTSLGNYTNRGVLEAEVNDQDILVAYNGADLKYAPKNTVGIWRTHNSGNNWSRSEKGIPESITDPYEYNVITSIRRSPHRPEILISECGEAATYRSTDYGSHWGLIRGRRGVLFNEGRVRWNPYRPGEDWIFGTTSLFAPYLGCAIDYGLTGKAGVDFNALGFPSDGAVYDIAFDIGSPDIIYAATSQGLIKTTDGGYNWQVGVFVIPDYGFVTSMAEDPKNPHTIFLAGGTRIYYSSDGLQTIKTLWELPTGGIQSMVFNPNIGDLFIGTNQGIYILYFLVPTLCVGTAI